MKPRSEAAIDNLVRAAGEPSVAGGESSARVTFFPLGWCGDHYQYESKDYG